MDYAVVGALWILIFAALFYLFKHPEMLDGPCEKMPPPTFDDRLRELRDTFQSVYDLLYPEPTTRPVAGVGWCPPSPSLSTTDPNSYMGQRERHIQDVGLAQVRVEDAQMHALMVESMKKAKARDALVTTATTGQQEQTARFDVREDQRRVEMASTVNERFAALLRKDAAAIRERNAPRE